MTDRAQIVLSNPGMRQKAHRWIEQAPPHTRLDFKGPQRTVEQSDRMWAMLTDIATQATLNGRKWTTDQWKVIFLHELGREAQFIPSLDGKFIPYGQSSSDLSIKEMSDLIESMFAFGAEHGIQWNDPKMRESQEQGS
ncbi:recombination protein NinB [Bradyrhizobium sp. LLZ17]|uniref:Recombination protein NinB n=1 Tax=Bradyrhizobium sp. LLZ17 TaxID=3239388 RepID=A0AB39XLE8_9BRAD